MIDSWMDKVKARKIDVADVSCAKAAAIYEKIAQWGPASSRTYDRAVSDASSFGFPDLFGHSMRRSTGRFNQDVAVGILLSRLRGGQQCIYGSAATFTLLSRLRGGQRSGWRRSWACATSKPPTRRSTVEVSSIFAGKLGFDNPRI